VSADGHAPDALPAVILVTDGSCLGNPGPGGYAALLQYQGVERVLTGADPAATNNRMELQAVLEGLRDLKRPCRVTLVTDSQLVAQGLTTWLARWQANGWRTTKRTPVENQDLWAALAAAQTPHTLTVQQVRGHSGSPQRAREHARAGRGGPDRPVTRLAWVSVPREVSTSMMTPVSPGRPRRSGLFVLGSGVGTIAVVLVVALIVLPVPAVWFARWLPWPVPCALGDTGEPQTNGRR
jgi:ribonuclease HI